ncbi:hypothetical protein D3C78_1049720 [compost metagenome]
MGLGGQVHHRIGLALAEHSLDFKTVADIDLLEGVTLAGTSFGQGFEVTSVGQLVEVDHAVASIVDDVTNDRRTDEAGTAGNKDFHV